LGLTFLTVYQAAGALFCGHANSEFFGRAVLDLARGEVSPGDQAWFAGRSHKYLYKWEHHLQIGDFQIFQQAMLDYQIWLPNSTLEKCASNIRGPEICVGRMRPF